MNKQSLRQLTLKWYKKLRAEGFVDIEAPIHQHTKDKHSTWYFSQQYHPDTFTARQRYYELASQLVYDYPFSSKFEKDVWTLHAEGLSFDKIAKKLKSNHSEVNRIVGRISACIKM